MAAENLEIARSLKPSPLSFNGPRKVYEGAGGPCDLTGKKDRNQMVEWRFSKTLWTVTVAAGFATIASGTTRTAFRRGVGDDGADAGYTGGVTLTEAETNLLADGSLNNAKEGLFVGRAFGVIFDLPYNYGAAGQKTYDQFKDAYNSQLIRAIGETVSMSINNRDDAVERFLTLPQFWPSHSSMTGDGVPTVGTPWGPATLVPFNDDYRFYDDSKGNATQIDCVLPREIRLTEDPAQTIPAAYSVSMTLIVLGGPANATLVCDPSGENGINSQKVAMLRELMAGGMSAGDAARTVRELMG